MKCEWKCIIKSYFIYLYLVRCGRKNRFQLSNSKKHILVNKEAVTSIATVKGEAAVSNTLSLSFKWIHEITIKFKKLTSDASHSRHRSRNKTRQHSGMHQSRETSKKGYVFFTRNKLDQHQFNRLYVTFLYNPSLSPNLLTLWVSIHDQQKTLFPCNKRWLSLASSKRSHLNWTDLSHFDYSIQIQ